MARHHGGGHFLAHMLVFAAIAFVVLRFFQGRKKPEGEKDPEN